MAVVRKKQSLGAPFCALAKAAFVHLLVVGPHAVVQAQDLNAQAVRLERLDRWAWEGPTFLKGRESLPQLRQMGVVVNERHESHPNPHDPKAPLDFVVVSYKDLQISGYQQSGKFLRSDVRITGAQWPVMQGLGVGASVNRVLQILGTPNQRTPDSLEYCGITECTRFVVDAARIRGVVFTYYVD